MVHLPKPCRWTIFAGSPAPIRESTEYLLCHLTPAGFRLADRDKLPGMTSPDIKRLTISEKTTGELRSTPPEVFRPSIDVTGKAASRFLVVP